MTMPPDPDDIEAARPQNLSGIFIKSIMPFLSSRRNMVPRAPLTIDGDDVFAIWGVNAAKITADPSLAEMSAGPALDEALRRAVLAELAPLVGDAEKMAAFCAKANAGRHNLKPYAPYREDIDSQMVEDLVEILTYLPFTGAAVRKLCEDGIPTSASIFPQIEALAAALEAAGHPGSKADHLALVAANWRNAPEFLADFLNKWNTWDRRRLIQALGRYTEQAINEFGLAFRELIHPAARMDTRMLSLPPEPLSRTNWAMRELAEMIAIDRRCGVVSLDGLIAKAPVSLETLEKLIGGKPLGRCNNCFAALFNHFKWRPLDDLDEIKIAAKLIMQLEHVVIALKMVPRVLVQWREDLEQLLQAAARNAVQRTPDEAGNLEFSPDVWSRLATLQERAQFFSSSILRLLPTDDQNFRQLVSLNMGRFREMNQQEREIIRAFISRTRDAVIWAGDNPDPAMLALLAQAKDLGL